MIEIPKELVLHLVFSIHTEKNIVTDIKARTHNIDEHVVHSKACEWFLKALEVFSHNAEHIILQARVIRVTIQLVRP